MIEFLLSLILLLLAYNAVPNTKEKEMADDIRWIRNYLERKSKNKWDSTFYDPTSKL